MIIIIQSESDRNYKSNKGTKIENQLINNYYIDKIVIFA